MKAKLSAYVSDCLLGGCSVRLLSLLQMPSYEKLANNRKQKVDTQKQEYFKF